MCPEVTQFSKHVEYDGEGGEPGVGSVMRRGGVVGWGVGEEGDVEATQQPVVSRVLEDIERRHRGVREPVHKQGLELSLEKVSHDHPE